MFGLDITIFPGGIYVGISFRILSFIVNIDKIIYRIINFFHTRKFCDMIKPSNQFSHSIRFLKSSLHWANRFWRNNRVCEEIKKRWPTIGSQVICEEIFSDEKRAQETKPSKGGRKKKRSILVDHGRIITDIFSLQCVNDPHKFFGNMGQCHTMRFALWSFLGVIRGKNWFVGDERQATIH